MQQTAYDEYSQEFLSSLSKLPLFSTFHEKHIESMIALSKTVKYKAGEPIFHEGLYENCFYILLSGSARISKDGELLTYIRRAGEIFGEMSVTDASGRSASVHAESETECLLVDISYTDTLPEVDKEAFLYTLYSNFVEVLTRRLKHTTEELVEAKRRIAQLEAGAEQPKLKRVMDLLRPKDHHK
jgi:CRP-like cAMP-binding protein